ncbi:PASTA domain-containing protein [Prevotella amnii]|uniref:Penicillin-binding protein n=1 Tax=Prevotella amnii DNF00058 TaxID=1401066 RepID=A0A096D5Y1_9BACT|nr:PASTA domain-containing protein [Prevotella amnii]KGF52964.1 penicillin-binding protein [Prevotella amnii DNF00058]
MSSQNVFKKLSCTYIWGNILAMVIIMLLFGIGIKYGIDYYTCHGESIVVPNVIHKQYDEAERIMDKAGLTIEVSDTGYVKELPPDCILEQTPRSGNRVKSTRTIYVTINAATAPTLVIPDIIDNNSLREATAQLLSQGFNVGEPEYIPGEKDWIYGIIVNGKHVQAGDRVPIDAKIILQVGDGTREILPGDSLDEPQYEEVQVEKKVPKYDEVYEYVEVPVDENGNEIPTNRPLTVPSVPTVKKESQPKDRGVDK